MKKIWFFLLVLSGVTAAAGIVEVEPSRAQILLPKGAPGIVQFAAKELSTLESVTSTATHFVLRRYKELDVELLGSGKDERGSYLL